jgi:hypothetical protein
MIIKGIEKIPASLGMGRDVYDDLTYCMQQWQEAGYKAAMAMPEPATSDGEWVISLVGNLLWAATVFFPPAFVEATATKVAFATASTATNACSMLGSAVAAGVVGKLVNLNGNLNSHLGKQFMADYLSGQVPNLLKQYAADADAFINDILINSILDIYSHSLPLDVQRGDEDYTEQFKRYLTSVAGAEARRKTVWERYVFLGQDTFYDNRPDGLDGTKQGGQLGLQKFIGKNLKAAAADFTRQWDAYERDAWRYAQSLYRPAYVRGMVWNNKQQLIYKKDYQKTHPFNPVIAYKGIPVSLQRQQQANRTRLANQIRALRKQ